MADESTPKPKKLEIKKYPNRRYYDATHSRHFTLEEIRTLIQQGYDIHVTDAKTCADITAQILTQIILELDTPKLDSLPVPLLLRLIRMNDQLIKDFIEKYFNQALKSFLDYQQQLEEQLRQTHGLPPGLASVSAWTKAMLAPFAAAFAPAGSGQAASSPKTDASKPPQEGTEWQAVIRDLKEQIAELKRDRAKTPARPHRRKSRPTST